MIQMSIYYTTPTQISPHFNSNEFQCKCGCRRSLVDERLIDMLEKLYSACNAKQINVVSGYRCPTYDKKIGGFAGYHSKGMAADIQVIGYDGKILSTKVVSCIAQNLFEEAGIANITKGYTNIHIDSRRGTRWLGNEVVSNGTVTKDFYKYYGLTKADIDKAIGVTPTPVPTPEPKQDIIKGICQVPDNGKFLLGLEVYENKNYTYEIQIYSDKLKAWVDGSGKVNNGVTSFWWYYTPFDKGTYMSLFRVYDDSGNVLDERTYLFEY